ncbi:hypothetical protein BC828DRAFT_365051 [Blastocladiella britannica]|nr:hypothetical protein BC828DRAFT_365051 [Blastocladiella britannica]
MPLCLSSRLTVLDDSQEIDFSTCFQHTILYNVPSLILLLVGLPRLAYLAKRQSRFAPNALLFVQLAVLVGLAGLAVAQAVLVAGTDSFDNSLLIALVISAVSLIAAVAVQYLEHTKMPAPSTLLSVTFFFRVLASVIALHTYIRLHLNDTEPTFFALFVASGVLSVLAMVLTSIDQGHGDPNDLEENTASPFAKFSFTWLFPMLIRANKTTLDMDSISDTSKFLRIERLEKMRVELVGDADKGHVWLIVKGVFSKYWILLFLSILSGAASLVASFISPRLLSGLLNFVDGYSTQAPPGSVKAPVSDGLIFAIGMFIMSALSTMGSTYAYQLTMGIQQRVRIILQAAIYRKALAMSLSGRKDSSVGEIVNRMSVDTNDLVIATQSLNDIWLLPITIGFALYFLFSLLGWAAFAGLGVLILIAPAGIASGTVFGAQMKIKMGFMDTRVKVLNEMIAGMKSVKMLVLEEFFKAKVVALRNSEQGALRKLFVVLSFAVMNSAEVFLVLFCFVTYALISPAGSLTPSLVFVSLAYLNLLLQPLGQVMQLISTFSTALVAYRRISEFLDSVEYDNANLTRTLDALAPFAFAIKDASFKWGEAPAKPVADKDADAKKKSHDKDAKADAKADASAPPTITEKPETAAAATAGESLETVVVDDTSSAKSSTAAAIPFSLTDITLNLPRGKLTAIVGRVGTGKTTLLHAILGELEKTKGTAELHGSVAYAPQQPWIFNATFRDNITFGNEFDLKWYNKVVEACALTTDIEILKDGDSTKIGDKGVNLSGGQKARLALARAVYADRDIILLDDCLSAVDAHVDKHIFTQVLGPRGLLRKKSVLFVTHGVHHLAQCDEVALLKDGTVAEHGSFEQVMALQGEVFKLVTEFSTKKVDDNANSDLAVAKAHMRNRGRAAAGPQRSMTSESLVSSNGSLAVVPADSDDAVAAADTEDDDSSSGVVGWDVYMAYLKACGYTQLLFFVPLFLFSLGCMTIHTIWLEIMSSAVAKANTLGTSVDLAYYLGVYGGLSVVNAFAMGLLCVITMVIMSIRASRTFHTSLVERVLHAPMSWYDVVPAGRIVNRFSSDIDMLDLQIPLGMLNFTFGFGAILSTLVIMGITSPWVLVVMPFGTVYLYVIARFYLNASRELQRMASATKAPVYQKFEETLQGLVSIRAFQVENQFTADMAAAIDRNTRPAYLTPSLNRWLMVNSSILSSFFILGIGLIAVFMRGSTLAGLIGLGLTQAQQLTWTFRHFVMSLCDMETKMVAVERIRQYSQVPQEAPVETDLVTDAEWPATGQLEFNAYSTTYREGLDPVLRGVSIAIPAGCKVGVVGRTGAGKSSLTLALFRIIEALDGSITLDGVDIAKVGLRQLRSQLCIIPQDPMLFEGTIRDNLDPLNQHDDAALWRALELANMSEYVSGLDGKLLGEVAHGGSNFSAGQKQLVTLASAILRKRKIVIFDEATSATDAETDAVVQRTIRQEFADCTILTIAHRINTIRDSDRILVLDKGQVAEFDAPETLLKDPESLFTKLVRDSESQ